MSYVSSIYHIIFSTHQREEVLQEDDNCRELYFYILGVVRKHHCDLVRINSMPDHIHLLVELGPQIAISELVREIKRGSSLWIKQSGKFPHFRSWEREYAAFSVSFHDKETIRQYIIHQQEHHQRQSFDDELQQCLKDCGLQLYPSN